jgi:hypothetical protein
MNGLAASRPSTTVSSVGDRAAASSASSLSVSGVDSASTIMMATSPSSSTRPATTATGGRTARLPHLLTPSPARRFEVDRLVSKDAGR